MGLAHNVKLVGITEMGRMAHFRAVQLYDYD